MVDDRFIEEKVQELKERVRGRRLSDEVLRKLVILVLKENAGVSDIALALGLSEKTVRRYVRILTEEKSISQKQIDFIMMELRRLFEMSIFDAVNIQKELVKLNTKQARTIISYIIALKKIKNLESYIVKKMVPSLKNLKYKFYEDYRSVWR